MFPNCWDCARIYSADVRCERCVSCGGERPEPRCCGRVKKITINAQTGMTTLTFDNVKMKQADPSVAYPVLKRLVEHYGDGSLRDMAFRDEEVGFSQCRSGKCWDCGYYDTFPWDEDPEGVYVFDSHSVDEKGGCKSK